MLRLRISWGSFIKRCSRTGSGPRRRCAMPRSSLQNRNAGARPSTGRDLCCKGNGGDFIKPNSAFSNIMTPRSLPKLPVGVPSLLNSSDSPSEPPASTEPDKKRGASPDKTKESKKKWTLNQDAFDQLLNCFSSDRDKAAVQYDLAYRKVVRYFEWRSIVRAEACADETMDRVARRITECKQIDKPMAYIFGV